MIKDRYGSKDFRSSIITISIEDGVAHGDVRVCDSAWRGTKAQRKERIDKFSGTFSNEETIKGYLDSREFSGPIEEILKECDEQKIPAAIYRGELRWELYYRGESCISKRRL